MICVLNYGSGNVGSVYNVLKFLGYNVIISNNKTDIQNASHLILPGVGAFKSSMKKINDSIPLDILEKEVIKNGKPFLGICVGMQVLANRGDEGGVSMGLGWIPGVIEKIKTDKVPLPHIGWNNIKVTKETEVFNGLKAINDFYFVHSYAFFGVVEENILAKVEYETSIVAAVNKDNIYGVQFHPEKSQRAGQVILKNFLNIS
jgi:imidazole glycerol-phosphate synthase subunit HisH